MNSIPSKPKILTRASRESKIKQTKREYQAQSNSPNIKSSNNNLFNNNKIIPDIFLNISINSQENSNCILNNFQYNTPTHNNSKYFINKNDGTLGIDKQNNKNQQENIKVQQKSPEQNFKQPYLTEENQQQLQFHFHSLSPSTLLSKNCNKLQTEISQNQNSYNQILDNFIDQTDKIIKKVQERKILNLKISNNNQQDFYDYKSNKFNYDQLEFKIDVQGKKSQEKQNQQQNILQEKYIQENNDLIHMQALKRSDSIFNKIKFQKYNNFISNIKDKQEIYNKENIVDNIAKIDLYKTHLNNTEIYKKQIYNYQEESQRNLIGQFENQNREIFNEPFDYYNFNNLGQKWDKFIGLKYENSYLRGILILSNGEKWEGLFKNGLLNGEGVFTQLNGNKVTGTWINDQLVKLN